MKFIIPSSAIFAGTVLILWNSAECFELTRDRTPCDIFDSAKICNGDKPWADYYSSINSSATNDELKGELQALINPHTVIDYDDIWECFPDVDQYLPGYPCDSNSSHFPGIYSAYCWVPEKDVTQGECGNYQEEGDCFNREHIWPKSWFGGFDNGQNAQSDLFELWPSDGYVNGLRGNLPYGYVIVSEDSYNSTSGALIGPCDTDPDDYQGDCFEPTDDLKGDLARSYFYLATAYWNLWDCCDEAAVNGSDIKTWQENMLREWHELDPVNKQERKRNQAIYENWQHNRNPYIDYPDLVNRIDNF